MALVYLVTNTINGSRYIGQTVRTLQERRQAHIYKANAKDPEMVFCRAIKKYGASNFHFEVIEENLSVEEACQLEIKLISELNPEYNVSPGGDRRPIGVGGASRPVICVTDGNRCPSLKAAAEAYGFCHKYIRKLCYSGESTKTGFRFMYEDQGAPVEPKKTENRKAAAAKKNGLLGAKAMSKPVICLDSNIVYPSISEAARSIGKDPCTVSQNLKCNRPVRGLRFAYYNAALAA